MRAADVEQALKSHMKVNLAPEKLAGRVFYSTPEGSPAYPLVTLSQVGGGVDELLEFPRISFDCWASKKEDASDVKRALLDYLNGLGGKWLDATTHVYTVQDIAVLYLREPESKLCRYIVDVTVNAATRTP
jgi:hypothetical protein